MSRVCGYGRTSDEDPADHGAELELVDQTRRASQPSLRGGLVTQTHLVPEAEVERRQHGLLRIGAPAKRRVCALPVTERFLGLTEPPQCDPEPEQRFARLFRLERRLERVLGYRPLTGRNGLLRRD